MINLSKTYAAETLAVCSMLVMAFTFFGLTELLLLAEKDHVPQILFGNTMLLLLAAVIWYAQHHSYRNSKIAELLTAFAIVIFITAFGLYWVKMDCQIQTYNQTIEVMKVLTLTIALSNFAMAITMKMLTNVDSNRATKIAISLLVIVILSVAFSTRLLTSQWFGGNWIVNVFGIIGSYLLIVRLYQQREDDTLEGSFKQVRRTILPLW
ncbi:MAG: hypothetical protein P8P30_02030 [Rickettsiales bacterium]|nr:hypothetical protein [Rickettsiales bacterium]